MLNASDGFFYAFAAYFFFFKNLFPDVLNDTYDSFSSAPSLIFYAIETDLFS
jgi:hypothetical protein